MGWGTPQPSPSHPGKLTPEPTLFPPCGMISHPGRTKLPLSLGKGSQQCGNILGSVHSDLPVWGGEGRGEQDRMLPTGADLRAQAPRQTWGGLQSPAGFAGSLHKHWL